ncbi:hypothetical protein HanIR_Chr02g0097611 [Helianthus annuus]|nr:hypothetical protein HanIR_Chr02g0097611 [Helianthus annuus]
MDLIACVTLRSASVLLRSEHYAKVSHMSVRPLGCCTKLPGIDVGLSS